MHFDVLIVVTPADCERLLPLYPRLADNFEYGKLCFIGSPAVGELVENSVIADHARWVDENDIVKFDDVYACMEKKLELVLGGEKLPRGVVGWYYQQFLKMQYASICTDEYYMVWDGDTVPCRRISMFSQETGQPYLDLKHEYHKEYFDTMGVILPGFRKVIERSFISEHMLFKSDIMKALIQEIEKNDTIPGAKFWEKIINSIEPKKIYDSSFSEFETYGTFVALRYPNVYKLREWHSFRLGASFFDMDTICARDFEWLGRDFDAISFEKGQSVREDNKGFFDNPEYQQKLSAKKMLQLAQMEYKDGYKEIWEDDIQNAQNANVTQGGFYESGGGENRTLIVITRNGDSDLLQKNLDGIPEILSKGTFKIVETEDISSVGFAKAVNDAVSSVNDPEFGNADVLIMSDKTLLIFDTLYFLRQALFAAEDIGAAGCVSNCAGNKQQIEANFESLEEYVKFGEKNNQPMQGACLERVRLSTFAVLIKRKAWNDIGGLDEEFGSDSYVEDALSTALLKNGYRLQLVRNSFIYNAGTDDRTRSEEAKELFVSKFGFDPDKYAYADINVISKIPFTPGDRFSVLHYDCGIGAELKAIRSLFPLATMCGIENNGKLHEIVKKTEDAYGSLDELMEFAEDTVFDILIIDKDTLENMDEAVQGMLSCLLAQEPVVLTK